MAKLLGKNMRNNIRVTIGLLILLFLIVWAVSLFSFFYDTFEVRERHAGLIADSIINNKLVMPLLNYQYLAEKGDALIAGIITVPFFIIFGTSYISLKLVALFITAIILMLWLVFIKKYFGYQTMLFFGLIFIFSPPTFTKVSLMTWGFHGQANFYIILALLIFFYINFDKKGIDIKWLFWILGFVCGLGLYSVKIFAVFLLALIIFWIYIEKNIYLKLKFYFFILGLGIGYLPGIIYNLTHGKYLIQVTDMPLWKLCFDNFLLRLKGVFSTVFIDLPASFMFVGTGKWFSYFYFSLFCLALIVNYFNQRHEKASSRKMIFGFLILYFSLFIIMLNFSPHNLEPKYAALGYRYLVVIYPFMFLVLAEGLRWVYGKTKNKIIFIYFVCFLIMLFAIKGNFNRINIPSWKNMLSYKGVSYERLGWVVGETCLAEKGMDECNKIISKVPKKELNVTYEGLGFALYTNLGLNFQGAIEKVPQQYKARVYKGLGEMSVWGYIHNEDSEKLKSYINLISEEYLPNFIIGFARAVSLEYSLDLAKAKGLFLTYFSDKDLKYLYRGFGEAGGEWLGDFALQKLGKSEERFESYLLQGIVEGKKRSLYEE